MLYNFKQALYLFTILVVLGAVGYYIYKLSNPSYEIYQAVGQFTGFEDNSISIRGVFNSKDINAPKDLLAPRDFTFRVDETTKMEREIINWPTTSEGWEALGENFDLKDLPRKKESGSLENLKGLFGRETIFIQADFSSSIYGVNNPVASSIVYRLISLPLQ